VLTAEATPKLSTSTWTFTVDGLVEKSVTWTWDEIHALQESTYAGDIHCVTTWSKLGVTFTGVSVDTLFEQAVALPSATYVMARSHTGYTTNLPLADVTGGKAWVVWDFEGSPLQVDHDEPGFWEQNGYHERGDPWLEQRYQGD
jgi:DMSO/TMAO reductase YedYZ molybdopterin-dependent catalytic subunit